MPLQVGVIIEGHGEYEGVRTLLGRVWYDLLRGDQIEVLRPFRQRQGTLLTEEGLKAAVDAVKIRLGPETPDGPRKLVLVLVDAEDRCPRDLAPRLLRWAREARSDADIACVMPCPMFETWFVAAASSLAGVNGFTADLTTPDNPEGNGHGKGWIKKRLPRKYKETVDQPRFVARMDLTLCRRNSPSFDKLCREFALRLPQPMPPGATREQDGTDAPSPP